MGLPQGAKTYTQMDGNKVKSIWMEKATQFDFYDKQEVVDSVVEHVTQHFNSSAH